jgi:hypothetical protein
MLIDCVVAGVAANAVAEQINAQQALNRMKRVNRTVAKLHDEARRVAGK